MKENYLEKLRHSTAHLLAAAVMELYPTAKHTIGPVIENGFYYDFDFKESISDKDLPKIEKKMRELVKKWHRIKGQEVSEKEAREIFKNNAYKHELIDELVENKEKITVYQSGNFIDLCKGNHIEQSPNQEILHFKLLHISGAYWRGNEKNKMLTRIYGTAFKTQKELKGHLAFLQEAKKRDHRKLGKALNLFVIDETIGKGLPLLTPKGSIIRSCIEKYEEELELKAGFKRVYTPHIAKTEMYQKTGHWQHYRETMYDAFGIDGEEYVLKPMNCPHHYAIYSSTNHSYRDLPVRLSEPGTCYRYEKSGEVSGLLRVRALTIDDAHVLMTEAQVEPEFKLCIDMVAKMFAALGLKDYYVRVSLSDPSDSLKYISDEKIWAKAGEKLIKIVKDNNLKYVVTKGEASFYGPKLDYMVKDSLGREWQMSTLQLDLFMAKRLNLTYTDEKGQTAYPVILHRGLTGSIERTMAILIENYAGALPLWLSPIQVSVLPVSEKFSEFAKEISNILLQNNIRTEVDNSNRPLGAKIREQSLQKTPYLCIIGEKEVDKSSGTNTFVTVRDREGKDLGQLKLSEFIKVLSEQIEKKT